MARNSIAPGGYIGGEPPRRPTFNQLSGVWKLDDVLERQKNNTWSNPLGVEDVFSTWLYTGNGGTQTITNGIDLSGKGGLVWTKNRGDGSAGLGHFFWDTVRGNNGANQSYFLRSNATDAQSTDGGFITSTSSTGYTVGGTNRTNGSGDSFASWTFRKAAKFFDIVTYTGNGGTQNIAHNLGSAPGCIIIKSTSSATNWIVYHRGVGATQFLQLNQTNAAGTFFDYWNNTAPTSTQFTLGAAAATNTNGETYVAYLFAHDAGGFGDSGNESVIKCGSFQDGPSYLGQLVDLGWEPQWVMIKRIGSADVNSGFSANWQIYDVMRGLGIENNLAKILRANTTEAEISNQSTLRITSQGFVPNLWVNTNDTYVYIAIRRGPMKAPTDATKVFSAILSSGSVGTTATTGFPVDAQIMSQQGASGKLVHDRLRGVSSNSTESGLFLNTTSTSAENSTPYTLGWSNEGFKIATYWAGISSVYWNFRRAPGFFDIVAYTGNGTSGRTVAHNLGVTPELMIIKSRTDTNSWWFVYHATLGADKFMQLQSSSASTTSTTYPWNNTAPTSSVFTLYSEPMVNGNGFGNIAYLFASCPGVSKVGSYTGTGTTQQINCGFANGARFVLIKRTDSTGDWYVWDTARGIVSGNDPSLLLNSTAAEVTNTDYIDPYSPGFEISSTAPAAINANGGSFVFLAIA